MERWIVQSIGCKGIGAGNSAIDILKENEFGADVKMVSCKLDKNHQITNKLTGETSLAQNFKGTGTELDSLFAHQQYVEILNGWQNILYFKLANAKEMYDVKKLYYIFILRAEEHLYICAFEIDIDNIKSLKVAKANKMNVCIAGLIDDKYGESKIYKSKKRLKLRVHPKALIDNDMVIPLDLKFSPKIVDLREMIKSNQIEEYQGQFFDDVFRTA